MLTPFQIGYYIATYTDNYGFSKLKYKDFSVLAQKYSDDFFSGFFEAPSFKGLT